MKKILVIQSRSRPEMIAAEQAEYRRAAKDAELAFVSALDQSLPWNAPQEIIEGFDAVIIGGSGEFDLHGGRADDDAARLTAREILERLKPLIAFLLGHDFPTLGVCFGHQLIGEAQGGGVMNDPVQKKVGSFAVRLNDLGAADALFAGLPQEFVGQYGHKDSLTTLPQGAVVLAESPNCRFSALRYGGHVYTVQFHPELTAEDVQWKLQNSPGYLPEGVDISQLVKPSPEASSLIPKFIEMVLR